MRRAQRRKIRPGSREAAFPTLRPVGLRRFGVPVVQPRIGADLHQHRGVRRQFCRPGQHGGAGRADQSGHRRLLSHRALHRRHGSDQLAGGHLWRRLGVELRLWRRDDGRDQHRHRRPARLHPRMVPVRRRRRDRSQPPISRSSPSAATMPGRIIRTAARWPASRRARRPRRRRRWRASTRWLALARGRWCSRRAMSRCCRRRSFTARRRRSAAPTARPIIWACSRVWRG